MSDSSRGCRTELICYNDKIGSSLWVGAIFDGCHSPKGVPESSAAESALRKLVLVYSDCFS